MPYSPRSESLQALAIGVALAWAAPTSSAQVTAPGFRVFSPQSSSDTYLLDVNGQVVHTWSGAGPPGNALYLQDDGTLLRSLRLPGGPTFGGTGGGLERLAFDGTVLWSFTFANNDVWSHHDIEQLPNGNVLLIAWDRLQRSDGLALGLDPAGSSSSNWLPDSIVEIQPTGATGGNVVWEWHVTDHLIQDFDPTKPNFGSPLANPQRIDVNYSLLPSDNGDWVHANGIDYNAELDVVLLNSPYQQEFWLIDHSTTTAEAAGSTGGNYGKGGDLLYRWGNLEAYGAGPPSRQELFFQHGTKWIPEGLDGAGNLLIFNNRLGESVGQQFSGLLEIQLPSSFDLLPSGRFPDATKVWEYIAPVPSTFFSPIVSSVERLPNGNTLVCEGQPGNLFELDSNDNQVWSYSTQTLAPGQIVFQAHYEPRTLWTDSRELSTSTGGNVRFDLVAGTPRAGEAYFLLGSRSGTTPGIALGTELLPLNVDNYLLFTFQNPNSSLLPGSFGVLDALGKAGADLVLPAGLAGALAGTTVHHAFVMIDTVQVAITSASNALPLLLLP